MSIKKKLFVTLLSLLCVFAVIFCFSACTPDIGDNPDPGTPGGDVNGGHTFEEGWTGDDDYHWHASSDGSDVVDGKALHNWVEQTDKAVAATCSAAGSKTFKCEVCGDTKTETVAQLTHKWSDTVKKDNPTCTAAGREYKECTNAGCNATTTVKYLDPTGHTASEATCTESSVCSVCHVTVAPALGHEYAKVSETAATCTTEGTAHYACSHEGCNASYDTKTEAAKGHSIIWDEKGVREDVHTAAVCYTITFTGKCEDCEYTETKHTDVTNHVFVGRVTRAATCSAEGEKLLTCSCGFSKTETLAVDEFAHAWDNGTESNGITTFICGHNHEHTKTAVVSANKEASLPVSTLTQAGGVTLADTSIQLDEGVKNALSGKENVTISADTLSPSELPNDLGEDAKFINNDDTVYNLTLNAGGENISQLGGFVTVTVPYALSEDEDPDHIVIWYIDGNELVEIEGKYSNGNVVFQTNHFSYYTVTRMTPQQRCAKFGHAYTTYHEDPTCLLAGYDMLFCTRCGLSEKQDVPALGHDWEATVTAATCTQNGLTHRECKRCDVKYDITVVATGHVFTATVFEAATCQHSGHATYKCDNCDETYNTTMAQTAHAFKSTVIPATCTEAGYTQNVCINCGHENKTNHVPATGHTHATKVIAPTCTVDGFTLTYCSVCNKEISKDNIVKATGHNMSGGVCSVCGHGCEHNYVKGTAVAATCTVDGYTPYTCSKCNSSYKGDIVKATGHNFEVDKCKNCGEPNPAARDYYLNLVKTTLEGKVSITVTDFSFKWDFKKYRGDELFAERVEAQAQQVNVAKISLSLSANGDILGSGEGSIIVTIEDESPEFDCKFAIKDNTVYIIMECDRPDLTPNSVISLPFDYALESMSNGMVNYETVRSYLLWFNTDVNNVLQGLIKENADFVADAVKFVLDKAFVRMATADGYTYTVNFDGIVKLNEFIYENTFAEMVDALLGEGTYAKLPALVKSMLEATPETVLEFLENAGVNKEQVFTAVDAFMLLMKGEEFDSETMFEQLLEMETEDGKKYSTLSVAEIIMLLQAGEAPEKVEIPAKAECVKQLSDMVNAYLEQFKDVTVYDLIAQNMGGTSKELFDMVSGVIDTYLETVKDSVTLAFGTDKQGNITSALIELDVKELVVGGGNIGGGDDVVVKPSVPVEGNVSKDGGEADIEEPTRTEEVLTVKGKFEFAFGKDVTVDEQLIAQVKASKPVFEKNSVITAYSHKELEKRYHESYTDILTYRRGEEMLIHTDARGNIIKIVVTSERVTRNIGQVWTNYFNCWENVQSEITEYTINENSMVMVSKNYCGDIDMYMYVAEVSRHSESYSYNRRIHRKTQVILRDSVEDHRIDESEYSNGSVSFYYNTKDKQFMVENPHRNLKVNEAKSDIKCGGFYYMECENCGYHYERDIYHLDEHYYNNEVVTLKDGATSCEDGVIVSYVCRECKQVVRSYESTGHQTYLVDEIDLTKYGATCEHTIKLYGCACGHYLYTGWRNGNYGDKDHMGEKFDSIGYRGTYMYNDKEVRVFTCSVSDCAFSFAYYTDSVTDKNCFTTYRENLIFNVEVDAETKTVTGGTAYEKALNYSYGYNHSTKTVHTGDEHNYVDEFKCTVCGLKVEKTEYTETLNADKQPVKVVEIYTRYKDDPKDNTERRVSKYETTFEYSNGLLVEQSRLETRYDGAMKEENITDYYEQIETYEFDGEGKMRAHSYEERWYDGEHRLTETRKTTYEVVFVEDNRFEFVTERYESREYYNKEDGTPSETPNYWHKYEYDYKTNGYCRPVILESTNYGSSEPREGEVMHRPTGGYITLPTCTQQGTRLCAFCHKEVQDGYVEGHRYNNGKCEVCGLENSGDFDGRVVLEDLSYTSENEYVIGYYNRESSMFTISVSLINLEADEMSADYEVFLPELNWRNSNEGADELDYYRSGKISFSISDIAAAAEKNGLARYMIRVTFVSEYYDSELDFSITIDVHNWVEGELVRVNQDGEPMSETVKYCTVCGMVFSVGYVDWKGGAKDGENFVYGGYSYRFGNFELTAPQAIESVTVSEPAVGGELVFGQPYKFTNITLIENGEDVTAERYPEDQLEELRNNSTVVFTEDGTCTMNGQSFTYKDGVMTDGEITLQVEVNGSQVTITQFMDEKNLVIFIYVL